MGNGAGCANNVSDHKTRVDTTEAHSVFISSPSAATIAERKELVDLMRRLIAAIAPAASVPTVTDYATRLRITFARRAVFPSLNFTSNRAPGIALPRLGVRA